MFQDVLFVPDRNVRMRAAVLPLSAVAHGLLVLLLVAIPLIRSGDLPKVELTGVFLAPPPPAPPAPPPRGNAAHPGSARRRIKPVPAVGTGASVLTAPAAIPNTIAEEPIDWGGSEFGVPGGVDYGALGDYPKNIIDATLLAVGDAGAPVRPAGEVRMPRILRRVEPGYPEVARLAHIQGTVILEATTDIYGRVINVRVLKSVPLLDAAATDAVRQWLYEPMLVNGRPRGVVFTVTLRFELKSESGSALQ